MKIALLGDIALYGKYSSKNNNVMDYFSDASRLLREFDYVVGNLETPLCDGCVPTGVKSAHIKGDTYDINIIKHLNINAVNLANNHIFDYGIMGYESTIKTLKENDIEYFGIAGKQLTVKLDNSSLAFSGYCCYSSNGNGYMETGSNLGINVLNPEVVETNLVKNHENGSLNIVSVHAGQEHINYPNYDHIQLARLFSTKVPYVYYGHHPHVMQGIENYNDSLLAYSLGNFCFDDVYTDKSTEPLIRQSEDNKKGFILGIEVVDNKIIDYEIIPIYMAPDKLIVNKNLEIVQEVKVYSEYLNIDKEEYNIIRYNLLKTYIDSRKKARTIKWYVKRLNFRSIKLIIDLRDNKKLYNQYILGYLKKHTVNQDE